MYVQKTEQQFHRYYLGIEDDVPADLAAHRAGGDVEVTSRILGIFLERFLVQGGTDDVDLLVHEIAAPRCLRAVPFGRHRGVEITDISTDYVQWLRHESKSESVDARC